MPTPNYQGFVSPQDPRTLPGNSPTSGLPSRTIQMTPGDPVSLGSNPITPETNVQSDPNQAFGMALMSLLQKHQQLGTAPLVNQGLNASDTAAQASTGAALDPALRGYSPGVIEGAASNASTPYNPIMQGANRDQQTMSEQIRSLGSGIDAAKSFLATNIAAQDKARDDARTLIHQSFTDFGGNAFDQLSPKDQTDLEKKAGLPAGYIHGVGKTIKERELALKQQNSTNNITYSIQDIGGKTIRYGFDKEGNVVSKTELGNATGKGADIFGDAEATIKQYKDANVSRSDIEKQYSDAGKAIPPEVSKALDKLYPVTTTPRHKFLGIF